MLQERNDPDPPIQKVVKFCCQKAIPSFEHGLCATLTTTANVTACYRHLRLNSEQKRIVCNLSMAAEGFVYTPMQTLRCIIRTDPHPLTDQMRGVYDAVLPTYAFRMNSLRLSDTNRSWEF